MNTTYLEQERAQDIIRISEYLTDDIMSSSEKGCFMRDMSDATSFSDDTLRAIFSAYNEVSFPNKIDALFSDGSYYKAMISKVVKNIPFGQMSFSINISINII